MGYEFPVALDLDLDRCDYDVGVKNNCPLTQVRSRGIKSNNGKSSVPRYSIKKLHSRFEKCKLLALFFRLPSIRPS